MTPPRFAGLRRPQAGSSTHYTNDSLPDRQGELADPTQGRWAVENAALAQLLCWRPVPGFAPTEATFAVSVQQMEEVRGEFAEAARRGQLRPGASSPEALRLYTVVLNGVVSQQMANEPGADYGTGIYSSLTDTAFDMFFARYTQPRGTDADPRP